MPQPPTPAHLSDGPPAPDGPTTRSRPAGQRSAVLRAVGLLALVGVWLAIAGLGGPAVGKLSTVQSNDQETFLPVGAEAVQADQAAAAFDTTGALPAFIVFTTDGGAPASTEQLAAWGAFARQLPDLPVTDKATGAALGPLSDYLVTNGAGGAVPLVPSQDQQAALVVASLSSDKVTSINPTTGKNVVAPVVDTLRAAAGAAAAGGQVSVAGPAGLIADLGTAFAGIDGLLLLVALGAVLLILFVVYRAVVLPFLVLFTSISALAAAGGLVYLLADNGVLTLNGQSQGILFILVVGAATDYALLLVSRYREELTRVESRFTAMARAWRACVEPIAASAGTVIIGLLCLLLSDLNSNRSLGPIGALGIAASFVAALTLLPALLMAGRWLFWPRIPKVLAERGLRHLGRHQALAAHGPTVAESADSDADADADHHGRHEADDADEAATRPAPRDAAAPSRGGRVAAAGRDAAAPSRGGVWARVAVLVARHPRRIWLIVAAGLAVAFAFVTTLQASGTQQTDVFLTDVESVAGQDALAQHFPGGSGNPVVIIAPESATDQVVAAVAAVPGISGEPAAVTASGAPASAGNPQPAAVVDGRVQIQATLADTPDSPAAKDTVRAVRDAVHALPGVGDEVLVGGATAIQVDTVDTAERDLTVIIPAILLAVLLVLVLLLRSLVAALLLTGATVLSFGAALGVSALVFNHVFDFPGADPAVPLFSFVFLVALGVDYSIFLMTRAREEVAFFGPKEGVLRGLRVTGGVITSAGLVLAATFAALAVIPILFLAQIAFIVAFGVLLDTFIVRTLLVPALAVDLGWRTWWPIRPKPTKHQLQVRGEPPVRR